VTFEENVMMKFKVLSAVLASLAIGAVTAGVHASGQRRTLVVTMTNDENSNQIKVYDAESHALLQTLSTHGKGGVGGNARGIKQYDGGLVAAVNNGSGSVAVFRRDGDGLKFEKVIPTTSAPVSVDFGNDHLYVAGATTVDSSCFAKTRSNGSTARRISRWRVVEVRPQARRRRLVSSARSNCWSRSRRIRPPARLMSSPSIGAR